jgi:LAS superfamily LD-carboxypeptidase LdcB
MPEPVKQPRLDATLRLYENGKLPASLLRPIHAGGQLYGPAAWWFNIMWDAAKKDGVILRNTGRGYRSYKSQLAMFLDRYSRLPTLRRPTVTRRWNGHTWFLKRGKSPSASPGKSNHGHGLSVDLDVTGAKGQAVFKWMCAHGPTYGFFMESPSSSVNYEKWHWTQCNL